MSNGKSGEWGYTAGPSDAMKREIGQIAVNHAYCDPFLASLFQAMSGTDDATNLTIIQTLKLKGSSLADLVSALNAKKKTGLTDRIEQSISEYRRLSGYRNEIAHWQWGPSAPGENSATVRNSLAKKPDESEKSYSLSDLKGISSGLITTGSMIGAIAAAVSSPMPPAVSDIIFKSIDDMLKKVREATSGLPDPSAEELP